MPVFISYSHKDFEFVNRLAIELIRANVHVWVDKWEMKVGDSLLTRVQEAIEDADALLVVLSKASVKSAWCKKELNSGLLRELEEKRVVALPLLLEKCTIPIFLREKVYADFTKGFREGLRTTVESLAPVMNPWQSRFGTGKWHTDWAISWGEIAPRLYSFRLTMIDSGPQLPYVVLTAIEIFTNEFSSRWYHEHETGGSGYVAREEILLALEEHMRDRPETDVILEDQMPVQSEEEFKVGPVKMLAVTTSQRLGMDTGQSVYLRLRGQLKNVADHIQHIRRHPEPDAGKSTVKGKVRNRSRGKK